MVSLPDWQVFEFASNISVADMEASIRKGARIHLYLVEWREHKGLSVERLAERLDVDRTTVWRWETGARRPTPSRQAQIAAALDIEPADLWRRPQSRPSIDAMLRDVPDEVFDMAADVVLRLIKRAS